VGLLDSKTAVIIGGTTGIGLATAARFVDEGARVFITGRRQAQLDQALGQLGERANGVRGDVGAGADLDRLYAAVAEAGRGLDVVVANAGVTAVARIDDITEDHLDTLPSTRVNVVVAGSTATPDRADQSGRVDNPVPRQSRRRYTAGPVRRG
jgi:NADP-dependent 3-hydroxy acid dehydrogenase YdfG